MLRKVSIGMPPITTTATDASDGAVDPGSCAMPKAMIAAPILMLALMQSAHADAWTQDQVDYARHGFRNGAWDCYGRCSGARSSARRTPRSTTIMQMGCQQNLGDGRILISNGNMLPTGARTKITSYRPTTTSMGWSNGPCSVSVTR